MTDRPEMEISKEMADSAEWLAKSDQSVVRASIFGIMFLAGLFRFSDSAVVNNINYIFAFGIILFSVSAFSAFFAHLLLLFYATRFHEKVLYRRYHEEIKVKLELHLFKQIKIYRVIRPICSISMILATTISIFIVLYIIIEGR